MCALPRMWAWMTKTSVAAKPIASAHHGIWNPSVYAGMSRTTVAYSTTAVAPISATSSQMAAARRRTSLAAAIPAPIASGPASP